MKRCPRCDSYKSLDEFKIHKHKRSKGGWRYSSYCVECDPIKKRSDDLKRLYNLTQEQYSELDKIGESRCWICERGVEVYLCVDHCHKTNKIRGLLCQACNKFLGQIEDSIESARRVQENLVRYLEDNGKRVEEVLK